MNSQDEAGAALLDRLGALHTALLSDVLDAMGAPAVFFGPEVRPLDPGMRLAGRALTMRTEPMTTPADPPYQELIAGLARVRSADVVLITGATQTPAGMWGELLSIATRARGGAGVVIDGLCRDVQQVERHDLPVFARGASPLDSSGRQEVVEAGGTVSVAGGQVTAGDCLLGDRMGVIAFPADAAEEAISRAEFKDRAEATIRSELEAGGDLATIFARRGIL